MKKKSYQHHVTLIRFLFFIMFVNAIPINAQWTSLSTAGGDYNTMCFHNEKLLLAGYSGNLWQTTNQGTTWQSFPSYYSTYPTGVIVSDGFTIYASRSGQRVYKSTDDGATWIQIINGLPPSYSSALLISGEKVFAGNSFGGVFVSTNSGDIWTPVNNGISDIQINALGGKGDTIFAGTTNGKLFRSTNAGELWTDVTPSYSTSGTRIYFITIIDASVFIGATDFGSMGLVRSDDWGQTWVQDNDGIISAFALKTGGIAKIDTFLFVGMYSGGIYKRSINTSTWEIVSGPQMLLKSPPDSPSTYYLGIWGILAKDSNLYAMNTNSGLFRSTDLGATWQQITSNAGGGFDRRGLAVNNNVLYLGGDGAVFISTDNGNFWNNYHANVFGAARISAYAFIDSFVFAGHMNLGYGIRRSTDGGHFWIAKNEGLPPGASRNIHRLAKIGSTLFAATAAGIYFTSDYGESWNTTAFPVQYVSELHAHGSTLFAFSQYLLSRSIDMGQTWTTITNGIDPWDWVDVTSSGDRLILAGNGIRTSIDDGVSWTDITGNLPLVQFYSVAAAGDTIYAATAYSCSYSVNLGQSWTTIPPTGFPPLLPSFRNILVHGGYIYAGMGESGNLGGAWRIPVPGTTSVELIDNEIPNKFTLMQNYPNPFNPSTNIEFMIPQTGLVVLKIYTLLGSEVSTLTNEVMSPGTYKVNWDASGLSSGIYFSRLVFEGSQIVKQMLLLK